MSHLPNVPRTPSIKTAYPPPVKATIRPPLVKSIVSYKIAETSIALSQGEGLLWASETGARVCTSIPPFFFFFFAHTIAVAPKSTQYMCVRIMYMYNMYTQGPGRLSSPTC